MFTQGISEELGRPDDFHVKEAERGDRLNKPLARSRSYRSAKGGSNLASGHEKKRYGVVRAVKGDRRRFGRASGVGAP
jgi:hypothetical protein